MTSIAARTLVLGTVTGLSWLLGRLVGAAEQHSRT